MKYVYDEKEDKKIVGWFKKKYPLLSEEDREDFRQYYYEQRLKDPYKRDLAFIAVDFLRAFKYRTGKRGASDAMAATGRQSLHTEDYAEERFESSENQLGRFDDSFVWGIRSSQQRTVLKLYYGWGFNLKEIGDVLGVSESRISQLHTQGVCAQKKTLQANLSFEKQREREREEHRALSQKIQTQYRIQETGVGEFQALPEEKGKDLGFGTGEEIQEALFGAFKVNAF